LLLLLPAGARGERKEIFDSGMSEPGSLEGEKVVGSADEMEAGFGPIAGDCTGAETSGDVEGVIDDRGGINESELSSLRSVSCNGSSAFLREVITGATPAELIRQSDDACT